MIGQLRKAEAAPEKGIVRTDAERSAADVVDDDILRKAFLAVLRSAVLQMGIVKDPVGMRLEECVHDVVSRGDDLFIRKFSVVQALQHSRTDKSVAGSIGCGEGTAAAEMRHCGMRCDGLPVKQDILSAQFGRMCEEPLQVIELSRVWRGVGQYADGRGICGQFAFAQRVCRLEDDALSAGIRKKEVHHRRCCSAVMRDIEDADVFGIFQNLVGIRTFREHCRDEFHANDAAGMLGQARSFVEHQKPAAKPRIVDAVQQPVRVAGKAHAHEGMAGAQLSMRKGEDISCGKGLQMCAVREDVAVEVAGAEEVRRSACG